MQAPASDVKLLWTGGWDSTFRLLQLLLVCRVSVQPYYLEDATRPSTATELETMRRITARLHAEHPDTAGLLRETCLAPVSAIDDDPEIDAALRAIRKRSYIGDQYAWLPAFCRQHDIHDMELGIHIDDKVQALVTPYAQEIEHPPGLRNIRVNPEYADTPEFVLFGDFRFPLFEVDKVEMGEQAAAAGWGDIMEMTWFCHSPANGKPCGICPPCVYTIEEGLARRIPRSRRVLSFFYRNLLMPVKLGIRNLRAASAG